MEAERPKTLAELDAEVERDPLGEAIRVGRMIRHFTQLTLSELSGVSLWRLQLLERGYRSVSPGEFLAIWKCLTSEDPPSRRKRQVDATAGLVSPMKSELP